MPVITVVSNGMNPRIVAKQAVARIYSSGNQGFVIFSFTLHEEDMMDWIVYLVDRHLEIKRARVDIEFPQRSLMVLFSPHYDFQEIGIAEAASQPVPLVSQITLFKSNGRLYRLVENRSERS